MSIRPTKAYSRYKLQADALLDFVVLVAHSMPVLRAEIQKVKAGTQAALPRPDFFHKSNRSTPDDLLNTEAHYEQHLASYVLLTHFSFFESFVEDLIKEMIAFHGGASEFISRIEKRVGKFLARQAPDKTKLKRRLQDSDKPEWKDRYRKFSHELDKDGFRFPGELLAAYGVRNLVVKMKNLKAVQIPDVLVEALRVDLPKTEIEKYHEVREIRNAIAHGDPVTLTMRQAVEMTAALRGLAIKIASHTAENFFLIEKYIP
jgi:RiboL-PSP-HEPN